jgi:tRNA U34 5-methylaminomethyl-2-thiouridine-forming methyltransferase MnmC
MENPFESELLETSDGSHTLKLKGFDEQYHSVNGALQESRHVFLQSGFFAFDPVPDPMQILEVGMGTGLNALITAREAITSNIRVLYDTVEPYPLQKSVTDKLNFSRFFDEPWIEAAFEGIHQAGSKEFVIVQDYFNIRCFTKKLGEISLEDNRYHLVYFDAFGPDTQPEMWTEEVFSQIYRSMKPGGILVTYCVKGDVRRAMKAAGFDVKKIPGPPGKREMSRATKPE